MATTNGNGPDHREPPSAGERALFVACANLILSAAAVGALDRATLGDVLAVLAPVAASISPCPADAPADRRARLEQRQAAFDAARACMPGGGGGPRMRHSKARPDELEALKAAAMMLNAEAHAAAAVGWIPRARLSELLDAVLPLLAESERWWSGLPDAERTRVFEARRRFVLCTRDFTPAESKWHAGEERPRHDPNRYRAREHAAPPGHRSRWDYA